MRVSLITVLSGLFRGDSIVNCVTEYLCGYCSHFRDSYTPLYANFLHPSKSATGFLGFGFTMTFPSC